MISRSGAGVAAKAALFLGLLVGASLLGMQLEHVFDLGLSADEPFRLTWRVLAIALLFAVLMAIPFVPGVEIAVAMFALFGPAAAPIVYAGAVLGLSAAFALGRAIPPRRIANLAARAGWDAFAETVAQLPGMRARDRVALLAGHAPRRLAPILTRYRHLALAGALNLPGNFLIGGGGGVALVAGASRLYTPLGFVATIALATAPIPLAVAVFGPMALTWVGWS